MNYKLLADSKNGFTQYFLSRESGEEDLDELLRRAYSAGPVSPTCYNLKGERCYALQPLVTRQPQLRSYA